MVDFPEELPIKTKVFEGLVDGCTCFFPKWDPESRIEIILRTNGAPTILFPACLPLEVGDRIKAYIDLRVYSGGDALPISCQYKENLGEKEDAFKIEKLDGNGKIIAQYKIISTFEFNFSI